jgi:glutathionylspermidine synthase
VRPGEDAGLRADAAEQPGGLRLYRLGRRDEDRRARGVRRIRLGGGAGVERDHGAGRIRRDRRLAFREQLMRRLAVAPRPDLALRAEALGFTLYREGGAPYWDESACYAFTLRQIEQDLETPTHELNQMALDVVDRASRDDAILRRLRIPEHGWEAIRASWAAREGALYGRFDFSYDGAGPAILLEYNADTPTALYEAAVFQWAWLEELIASGALPAGADQFNSIHDKLVARFAALGLPHVHFTGLRDNIEDALCLDYLQDCAQRAGVSVAPLDIADVGVRGGRFVDLSDMPIAALFKLYPWEWLWTDPFGREAAMRGTRFIEPAWKAVLSNKGLLALLHEMDPRHPNIAPAFFDDDPRRGSLGKRFARKPLLSREGANIALIDGAMSVTEGGPYGAEGFVLQALAPLPDFAGRRPVIGSWVIGEEAAGIGVREGDGPITTDAARFVPHAILD